MAAFNRYGIYAAAIGGLTFRDLSDVGFRTASRKSVVIPGGDVHPRAVVECCADPVISMSTKALDVAFSGTPVIDPWIGYAINPTGQSSTGNALFQFQKRLDGGTFESGSAHVVGTSTKGFLCPTGITAQQDDEAGAKLSMEYYIHSTTGQAVPMTWSKTAALTSTPTYQDIWYLGACYVGIVGNGATQKYSVQSLDVKFGIDYRYPRGDGNPYATNGSVHAVVPEIRATLLDINGEFDFLSNPHGKAFSAINENSWQFFLQKGVHGGSRYAENQSVHIDIIATTGDQTTDSISVSQIDDARIEVILRPTAGIYVVSQQTINA